MSKCCHGSSVLFGTRASGGSDDNVIEANEKRAYGRTFGTEFGNPDLVELARAFGIAGYAVETPRDLLPTLRHALDIDGPSLVAVPWDHTQNEHIAQAQAGRAPVTPG